ncbi:unnamed protein product, partial [Discosporangium mesarthrocarpum]
LNIRDEADVPPSKFPERYSRGEVPCSRHTANTLVWVCPLEQLDYEHYLPMFFDGIRCTEDPCKTIARQGVCDLLDAACGDPERILSSLPSIVRAVRLAVTSKKNDILIFTCKALRLLVSGNREVGEALVGYYKMFLTIFNLFLHQTKNLGDAMDYSQRNGGDIGDAIQETVETLERHGGKNAFVNIKHCIPT